MRVFFSSLAAATFLVLSCGGSPELIAPVGFVSTPQEPEAPAITFADVEQARLSGRMDLYETSLLELTRSEDPDTRRRAFALSGNLMRDNARLDKAAVHFRAQRTNRVLCDPSSFSSWQRFRTGVASTTSQRPRWKP